MQHTIIIQHNTSISTMIHPTSYSPPSYLISTVLCPHLLNRLPYPSKKNCNESPPAARTSTDLSLISANKPAHICTHSMYSISLSLPKTRRNIAASNARQKKKRKKAEKESVDPPLSLLIVSDGVEIHVERFEHHVDREYLLSVKCIEGRRLMSVWLVHWGVWKARSLRRRGSVCVCVCRESERSV